MKITRTTLMVTFETEVKLGNNDSIELILEHQASISRDKLGGIDVDLEIEMAQDFEIKSVPTFVVMKDNKEIHRVTGAKTKQELQELIDYQK